MKPKKLENKKHSAASDYINRLECDLVKVRLGDMEEFNIMKIMRTIS